MIAADVEAIFVGIAIANYACLEVVTAWWSDGCIGGCVCGARRGGSESEREIENEQGGREYEMHRKCLGSRFSFSFSFPFFSTGE